MCSPEAEAYMRVCKTPCILSRTGKINTQQRLIPPPPLSLVPNFVVRLFTRVFDQPPKPGEMKDICEASHSSTPEQRSLLRRYGLVQPKKKKTTDTKSRRAYFREWRKHRSQESRVRRQTYKHAWFQRKKQDPEWYANYLAQKREKRAKQRKKQQETQSVH